jgi:ppGpp synthetase/RelA/SpoT-type nucleotidyltranferase
MGGLRVGREYEDRVPLLESMQSKNKFDYDEIQNHTNVLKRHLERSFPGMTVLARTKSMDSIKNKLKSEDYQGKGLHQIKDLIGARIICPMKGTLPNLVNTLENKIDVYRKRNYFRDNDERPMQANQVGDDYYGLNYLTNAGPWAAEVQMTVKPLEVWNDLQHGLIYKPAAQPDELLLEKLAHVRDNVLWHIFMGQR